MFKFFTVFMMLTTAALPSFSQSDIRDIIENIAKAAVSNIKTKYAESSQIQRIGVFNLDRQVLNEANLSYSAFENYLTDQIIISLMNNKERLDFDVVERGSLEKVMVEQQFSMTDLVDQSKSIEAGKLLNASIILTGTYQVLPDNVSLTVKLTDVQSGCIITVMSYEMEIDKRVDHLLGIKSDMAYRQKREQRQKELYRPQKNRSQNFFGGGVSMFYLNCKGETPINQYAGTLDVSFGYRRLVTSIGYGYFSYKYDLANNHFLLAGLSLKIIPFIKLGYMLGFPLDKDNSLGQTVSSRGQMAHYLKWTFLETNSVDLSFHYTILNNDAFAENVTKKNLELYGFGIGFH